MLYNLISIVENLMEYGKMEFCKQLADFDSRWSLSEWGRWRESATHFWAFLRRCGKVGHTPPPWIEVGIKEEQLDNQNGSEGHDLEEIRIERASFWMCLVVSEPTRTFPSKRVGTRRKLGEGGDKERARRDVSYLITCTPLRRPGVTLNLAVFSVRTV